MEPKNKILIVDDEVIVRMLIEGILAQSDSYLVKSVESAEEALPLMATFDPDIILLDIQMQGLDGYGMCEKIREDDRYRFTKIIMVSGCASVDERLRGYQVGADDYISKPFDDQELLAKVKVYANLKHREEVDQVKSDLLTLLTHETRTPVNGIIGCSDLLVRDPDLTEDQLELAQLILDAGQQLHQFLENAILLSKLKAGLRLRKTTESVWGMIRSCLQSIETKADEKNLTIKSDIAKQSFLYGDWQLIKQALVFVLDNAVKYANSGGVITVTEQVVDEYLVFAICDDGVGIAEDKRLTIFDEFSISDVAHHMRGQGISLAIAYQVLRCHGGEITVEDTETGQGVCFKLTFPIEEDA